MNIGITGHQKLANPDQWGWVEAAIDAELDAFLPPLVAITCLAVGSDQLLARSVLARGGQIHAVLPFADLERTFTDEDLVAYRQLRAHASVEILSVKGTDEDAYFAAGARVVELSDLLLAVWDGLPAKGKGGTADVVRHAASTRIPIVHMNPFDRTIRRYKSGEYHF